MPGLPGTSKDRFSGRLGDVCLGVDFSLAGTVALAAVVFGGAVVSLATAVVSLDCCFCLRSWAGAGEERRLPRLEIVIHCIFLIFFMLELIFQIFCQCLITWQNLKFLSSLRERRRQKKYQFLSCDHYFGRKIW